MAAHFAKINRILPHILQKINRTWPHNLPFWADAVPHNLPKNTAPKRCLWAQHILCTCPYFNNLRKDTFNVYYQIKTDQFHERQNRLMLIPLRSKHTEVASSHSAGFWAVTPVPTVSSLLNCCSHLSLAARRDGTTQYTHTHNRPLKLGSYVLGTKTKFLSGQNFDLGIRSENIELWKSPEGKNLWK